MATARAPGYMLSIFLKIHCFLSLETTIPLTSSFRLVISRGKQTESICLEQSSMFSISPGKNLG